MGFGIGLILEVNGLDQQPLIFIVGPTAVGKSAVGIETAGLLDGEVISGDSMQVYRGMDIGTAKVPEQERYTHQGVFIPHHLVDILEPEQPFSVREFQMMARMAITDIHQRGRIPILVGGTGLYIQAVIDPYQFVETVTDHGLRRCLQQEAEKNGSHTLYRRLQSVDPVSAHKIHPNDQKRVIRALEIYHLSGQPASKFQKGKGEGGQYRLTGIGLTMERQRLYQRINNRVEEMFACGLVDEVRHLLAHGIEGNSQAMMAIGYRQVVAYLKGEYPLETAKDKVKQETRRFAKRQYTWFRRDERITWLDVEDYRNPFEIALKIAEIFGRTT